MYASVDSDQRSLNRRPQGTLPDRGAGERCTVILASKKCDLF